MFRPLVLALATLSIATPLSAGGSPLEGTWLGEGIVLPRLGEPEAVTCKVFYWQTSATVHEVAANCTSASFEFQQVGELTTVRDGRYIGEFENAQYQIRGKLRVLIDGDDPNGQAVTFTSDQATGEFKLTRL
ncbi:MAG: hypothetical protein R3D57_16900 [Hyphomicrobiaceae bacterium]